MANTVVNTVQITGITVHLEKPLDHSVLIELILDGGSRSVQLKPGEMPVGDRSLHPPLELGQGSTLSIHVQEKGHIKGDQTLAQLLVSPEIIWLASSRSVSDDRIKNFPIPLKDPKKQIWLKVVELPSASVPCTRRPGRSSPVPKNVSQTRGGAKSPLKPASRDVTQKLPSASAPYTSRSSQSSPVPKNVSHAQEGAKGPLKAASRNVTKKLPSASAPYTSRPRQSSPVPKNVLHTREGAKRPLKTASRDVTQKLPPASEPYTSRSSKYSTVPGNTSHVREGVKGTPKAASRDVMQKLGEFKMALERLGGDGCFLESVKSEGIVSQLCLHSKAVLDSVNTFYQTQGGCDRELLELAMSMERTVNLLQPVKEIAELIELKKPLEMFPDLMTRTIDLIGTWAKQSVLANSVLTQPNKDEIDDLNKHYTIFEKEFGRGLQIDTAVKEYPALKPQELEELQGILLDGIKPVNPKAVACIEGTRTTILEEIETKIDDRDGANILWIRGAPGSGKSSLSLSAKSWLLKQSRLVAYYRFDRNESATTTAIALWRRVAYHLACQFPAVGMHILQKLRDPNFEFDSPMTVFTSLVETPLSELIDLPNAQPLVIVIDALDECGGRDGRISLERKQLLQTLRRWPRLPKYIKLLLTSREESDIIQALSTISLEIRIHSGSLLNDKPRDPASIAASEDIRTFLEHRLSEIGIEIQSVGDRPRTKIIGDMVHRAAGNFMWATAATDFIEKGLNPEDRLHRIMSDASLSSSMDPLYSLYCTILETACGEFDESEAATLRAMLGAMLCAKRTLSDEEYIKLPAQDPISTGILKSIRRSLGSIIVTDGNLRLVHKSVDDFLCSTQCPPKYKVNVEKSHYLLTNLCLRTMGDKLRFNLCDLETSCLKNKDVPDIGTKVANGIPPLLSYSCCFWAEHLSLAPSDQHLADEVTDVVRDKLLYWFEAMSLLKEINRVPPSLLLVLKWFHSSPDDEFKEFLSDARRFIATFGMPIAQSAPHIYISALPFSPENSSVAKYYLPRFPQTLTLTVGKPTNWSPRIFSLKLADHGVIVRTITLSPDEKYIALRSDWGEIFISDSETGNLISGPFVAPENLRSVFFVPDSQYIWAACQFDTMVGFNIETGETYHDFKVPHAIGCCRCNGEQYFISVEEDTGTVTLWSAESGRRLCGLSMGIGVRRAILSPNGRYIAGISADETVEVWRLVDGSEIQLVRGPSMRQLSDRITSLSFSVDSNFVVSGLWGGTIQIWDARTGDMVGAPLSTGSYPVHDVVYSHGNRRLISLDADDFATVWNTTTCKVVFGPLSDIPSIALSRDGRRAFLGTWSGEVTKWDLDLGNIPAIQSNAPFPDGVEHVAFSPCGTKLGLRGFDSETLCFWDARTYEPLHGTITLPPLFYTTIFTPDGSHIVIGTWNGVSVWNVDTRELAFSHNFGSDKCYIAFRSTDRKWVVCSRAGDVHLWNLEDRAPPSLITTELPGIDALSPDGLTATVYDKSRTPYRYLWSTITCQPLPFTFADVEKDSLIFYSPTGPLVAITSHEPHSNDPDQTTLRVWNTQTGELTAGPWTIHGRIAHLAFSYDNSHTALSLYDCTMIWIWNALSGSPISGFWAAHTGEISTLDFSPDGERLVSGSFDGQVRIWNTAELLGSSPVPVEFMCDSMDIRDGWVTGAGEKLGFWVPPDHREKLTWNGIVAIIGGKSPGITTHVDLTRFKYGGKWTECLGEVK